mgnify:CR=1 FL=1
MTVMDNITCANCGKALSHFDEWFGQECDSETGRASGHALTWEKILALRFKHVAPDER